LAGYKAAFKGRVPAERLALMEGATARLKDSGIEQRALRGGAAAPDLSLPDAAGRRVGLKAQWQRGRLVIVFYRGGWCPCCNLEPRAWQAHLAALAERVATLVAVSPQTPHNSLSTAEKHALAFPGLSDPSLALAEAFGVVFELPPELLPERVELYDRVGNDLPTLNGNGRWVLPVPATDGVDTEGRIGFAHSKADYRERAEPALVIGALARAAVGAAGRLAGPPSAAGQ
jgi:peroxiredoxin